MKQPTDKEKAAAMLRVDAEASVVKAKRDPNGWTPAQALKAKESAMSVRNLKPRPPEKIASEFIRARLGKRCFAPMTGTDWKAWHAFVHLLTLWGYTLNPSAVDAMRATVACAQTRHEDVMQIFVQTIPAVLDWGDVARLWPQICPATCTVHTAIQRAS